MYLPRKRTADDGSRIQTARLAFPKPQDRDTARKLTTPARLSSTALRVKVFIRDQGVCNECKLDTNDLRMRWLEAINADQREWVCNICDLICLSSPCECGSTMLTQSFDKRHAFRLHLLSLGFSHAFSMKYQGADLWACDHVTEHADGGSDDLANLQTLCAACHSRKTGEYAKARAFRRKF